MGTDASQVSFRPIRPDEPTPDHDDPTHLSSGETTPVTHRVSCVFLQSFTRVQGGLRQEVVDSPCPTSWVPHTFQDLRSLTRGRVGPVNGPVPRLTGSRSTSGSCSGRVLSPGRERTGCHCWTVGMCPQCRGTRGVPPRGESVDALG